MKLAGNGFTHALSAGKRQIGLWVSLCSTFVACGTDASLLAKATDGLPAQVRAGLT
jgi:2-keto-3-deoxy-L-rhamnonate aldolase RhmA